MPDLRAPVVPAGRIAAMHQPTIEAAELVLRPWRAEDAATLVHAYADPEIRRWHVRSMDEHEALDWIRERHERWHAESGGDWLVLAHGEPGGRVGMRKLELRDGCAEVGYWVLPEARRRGIATAAVRTLSAWLLEEIGLRRLELEHSTGNQASCGVALKAGFAAEGIRRAAVLHEDGWHDMHVHALLRVDAAERPAPTAASAPP